MERYLSIKDYYLTIIENEDNDSILGENIFIYTKTKDYEIWYNMKRKGFFLFDIHHDIHFDGVEKEIIMNILEKELRRDKIIKIKEKLKN